MTEKNVYVSVRLCDTSAPGLYMVSGVEKHRLESPGEDQGDKDIVAVELKYKVGDSELTNNFNTSGLYVQASPEKPDATSAATFFRLNGTRDIADLHLRFPNAVFVDAIKVSASEPAGLANPARLPEQLQRITPELLREHSSSHRSKRSRSSRYSSATSDSDDSSTDQERDHSKSTRSQLQNWLAGLLRFAKAKHREITRSGISDAQLLTLEHMQDSVFRNWSKDSETGQAAIVIINLCTEYEFLCYATAYDMRSTSDTLSTSMTQATQDMADEQVRKVRAVRKVKLSKLLKELKTKQPGWQKQAQERHDELKRELREKRHEDQQMKLNASLERAFTQQITGANRQRTAPARSNGVCYSWNGSNCPFGDECRFAASHIRGQTYQNPRQNRPLPHSGPGHGSQYPRIEES